MDWCKIRSGLEFRSSRFRLAKNRNIYASALDIDLAVYNQTVDGWKQLGEDINVYASGNPALDANGDIVAVQHNKTHVRVYKWSGTKWNKMGQM